MYTSKNHSDGPDKTVIGGELAVEDGGSLVIETGGSLLFGETEVQPAAAQADSTATDAAGAVVDFNALLAKLRAAGLLASE